MVVSRQGMLSVRDSGRVNEPSGCGGNSKTEVTASRLPAALWKSNAVSNCRSSLLGDANRKKNSNRVGDS